MGFSNSLRSLIPARVKGWARYKRGYYKDYYPFGFAMNGQTARLEATREVLYRAEIESIVETGTFRGTTTEWFAGFSMPVLSIEAHLPTFEFARRRLEHFRNVTVRFGSSVEVFKDVLPKGNRDTKRLFYLDAHWEDHLPLKEELELICTYCDRFVVLIDDFQVPHDQGYTFDNYGPGKALTTEYLASCHTGKLAKFYPSTPSWEETGLRRGWLALTNDPEFTKALGKIHLLRQAE